MNAVEHAQSQVREMVKSVCVFTPKEVKDLASFLNKQDITVVVVRGIADRAIYEYTVGPITSHLLWVRGFMALDTDVCRITLPKNFENCPSYLEIKIPKNLEETFKILIEKVEFLNLIN